MAANDELTSLVIDTGSKWTKAGLSGEESPKTEFLSVIGSSSSPSAGGAAGGKKFVGDLNIHYKHEGMEIEKIFENGEITNFDSLQLLWEHAFDRLGVSPEQHPVLLTESPFYSAATREKLAECLFEGQKVPAAYLSNGFVQSAFAAGRGTALIVDIGNEFTSVVPVYDGFALKNAMMRQPIAGKFLSEQVGHLLEKQRGIEIIPQFRVQSKKSVGLNQPADYSRRSLVHQPTASFDAYSKMKIFDDFKECVCQVTEINFSRTDLAMRPPKYYEFPNGLNSQFGVERFCIPEILFDPRNFCMTALPPGLEADTVLTLPEMIHKAILQSDVEARPHLYSNIILTGGSSLFPGMVERLTFEMGRLVPMARIKIHAGATTSERKYSAWIGGSTLASLGSFQQLWMTKEEYSEHGASFIAKKCQ